MDHNQQTLVHLKNKDSLDALTKSMLHPLQRFHSASNFFKKYQMRKQAGAFFYWKPNVFLFDAVINGLYYTRIGLFELIFIQKDIVQ